MNTSTAMSMWLAVQLLVASIVGPNVLHLCADGCVSIGAEAAECLTADTCCPGEVARSGVTDTAEPACEWCVTIEGDAGPMVVSGSAGIHFSKTANAAVAPASMPSPPAQVRLDRKEMATGPPPAIAHLRTVRLLV